MKYELQDCIGSRLRSLSRKVDNVYRKHLKKSGVTENQLSIMMALYKMGQTEQILVGKYLNLERSSLSRNLIRLVDNRLVVKEGAVNRPLIVLSDKGKLLVERLMPAWESAMDEVLTGVKESTMRSFVEFEKQVAKS